MEIPDVSRRHRILDSLISKKHAAVDVEHRKSTFTAQFPAQDLDNRRIPAMAVEHGNLFKAVTLETLADVIEHTIERFRLQGNGTAEVDVLCA